MTTARAHNDEINRDRRRAKAVAAGRAYGATEFIVFEYGVNLYGWALYNSPLYKHVCALESSPMFDDCYAHIRSIERIECNSGACKSTTQIFPKLK